MNNSDVLDLLEHWVAERKLSRRQTSFLRTVYEQAMECMASGCAPSIAGGAVCSDLDLPEAVYTCQLVAHLLDHLKPLQVEGIPRLRLVEITEALLECDHLTEEEAEDLYAMF